MRLYLTVRPEDVREAAPYRRELAHAAYHIGEESALLRRNLLVQTSGGLLVLSDRGAPPVEDPEGLAGSADAGAIPASYWILKCRRAGTYPTLPPPSDGAAPPDTALFTSRKRMPN